MSSLVSAQITFSDPSQVLGRARDRSRGDRLLAYVVYFRRHRRRDLLMAYVCFNVALFAVVTALTSVPASANSSADLLSGSASWVRSYRSSGFEARS